MHDLGGHLRALRFFDANNKMLFTVGSVGGIVTEVKIAAD